jgi:hypothetical protein
MAQSINGTRGGALLRSVDDLHPQHVLEDLPGRVSRDGLSDDEVVWELVCRDPLPAELAHLVQGRRGAVVWTTTAMMLSP